MSCKTNKSFQQKDISFDVSDSNPKAENNVGIKSKNHLQIVPNKNILHDGRMQSTIGINRTPPQIEEQSQVPSQKYSRAMSIAPTVLMQDKPAFR